MIGVTLDFLCKKLNDYLFVKADLENGAVSLYNVSQLGSEGSGAGASTNVYMTLVNIEEDRVSKSHENFIRKEGKFIYQNPKVHLNLYLLFSVNLSTYLESLKRLSLIIQFFQWQNVFTPLTTPGDFPEGVEELILDLHTVSLQDLNNLWGILGSKYLPSVMYKLRMITISENMTQGEAGLIKEIAVSGKNIS